MKKERKVVRCHLKYQLCKEKPELDLDWAKVMDKNHEDWTIPWKLSLNILVLYLCVLEEIKSGKSLKFQVSMSTETIHDVHFSFWLPEPSLHTCLAKCSSRSYFKFVFPLEATPLCKLQTRHMVCRSCTQAVHMAACWKLGSSAVTKDIFSLTALPGSYSFIQIGNQFDFTFLGPECVSYKYKLIAVPDKKKSQSPNYPFYALINLNILFILVIVKISFLIGHAVEKRTLFFPHHSCWNCNNEKYWINMVER